jgi:tight adherence protein B
MKVKALSSEATTSAMVLAALPPMVMAMLSMTSPDYLMPLFVTKSGTLFLGFALLWMGIGVMVMRWMINFKF